jgi:4,5-DOPA dioxygenase extradiol
MDRANTSRMPVLFIGHGSPMNAIETNDFTECLQLLGKRIPKPRAILCISAHWLTEGTWVTHMPQPKTIHDFYGFPKALFDIEYPAPGSLEVADLVKASVQQPTIQLDDETWGLDHGTWSVLRHLYPEANIPVIQLSIYLEQPGEYHYRIGQQLKLLRDQGILIVGSGNTPFAIETAKLTRTPSYMGPTTGCKRYGPFLANQVRCSHIFGL